MKTRVDGRKIQEIKDNFTLRAQNEIDKAVSDGTELNDEDIKAIHSKHQFEAQQRIDKICSLGPKRLHQMGMALDMNGWRTGFTKQTVEKRAEGRHRNRKMARKSRMVNAKKK